MGARYWYCNGVLLPVLLIVLVVLVLLLALLLAASKRMSSQAESTLGGSSRGNTSADEMDAYIDSLVDELGATGAPGDKCSESAHSADSSSSSASYSASTSSSSSSPEQSVCTAAFFIDPWYDSNERSAIIAAAKKTYTEFETPRSIDLSLPGLTYRASKGETFRTSLHAGQRKLYLSELDFLTLALRDHKDGAYAAVTVVYAGAAPSLHTPHLAARFPNVDWHLYDPAKFGIRPTAKIHLYNEYFTDKVARSWAGRCDFFICDIRLNPDTTLDLEAYRAAFEVQVETDMGMQATWVQLIKPKLSMLKFRLPYAAKTVKYFAGTVRVQAFAPHASTEMRLITDGSSQADYDSRAYEEWFYMHNSIRRDWLFYEHGVRADGLDHCADCALEVAMQRDYLRLAGKGAPSNAEIGKEIDALTIELKRHGLKGLRFEAHGVLPEIAMCHKRKQLYDKYFEAYRASQRKKHHMPHSSAKSNWSRLSSKPNQPRDAKKAAPPLAASQ